MKMAITTAGMTITHVACIAHVHYSTAGFHANLIWRALLLKIEVLCTVSRKVMTFVVFALPFRHQYVSAFSSD